MVGDINRALKAIIDEAVAEKDSQSFGRPSAYVRWKPRLE